MTVNDKDFAVIRLLGKGKGGYSYLVTDGAAQYVLKQIHHEPCDYYQFGDKMASELEDYEKLHALGISMPRLLEVDHLQERLLKTYIDGMTVQQLVEADALPQECILQMQKMCQILYPAGLNIDYYPTNFVFAQGILYYIDYECNPYSQQWDFENWGIQYWQK